MAITIRCSGCGVKLRVRDEYVGRRGRCTRCGATIEISAAREQERAPDAAHDTYGIAPEQAPPSRNDQRQSSAASNGAAPEAARQRTNSPAAESAQNRLGQAEHGTAHGTSSPPPASARPSPKDIERRRAAQAKHGDALPHMPRSRTGIRRDALAGFSGEVERVGTTFVYRLGILAVTGVMILLPIIYLVLIGLVCLAVGYHATHHTRLLEIGVGRGRVFMFLVYAAPMIIGPILIFFMCKPFFARPADEGRRRSITRQGEPLVFEFVERICDVVDAPRPKRIDVDWDVNASARFRRGTWSMIVGNDLVLTIGVPLIGGLNLNQFAGVLAHEFGHFGQGAGMRVSSICRSINFWFVRVVYQRDAWDEWLAAASTEFDLRVGWILLVARLFVFLSRAVLWILMIVGHVVCGFLLRQMEFDADQYEIRLVGSEVFGATARRLRVLGAGAQLGFAQINELSKRGGLPDNLPMLMLYNIRRLDAAVLAKIEQQVNDSQTSIFDSHPSDRDRIEAARKTAAEGVFHTDLAASDLFSDYTSLARNVTFDLYRAIVGPGFTPSQMTPTVDLLKDAGQAVAAATSDSGEVPI